MSAKKNSPIKRSKPTDYEGFLRGLKLAGLGLEKCAAELERAKFFELEYSNRQNQIKAHYGLLNVERDFFNAFADFVLHVVDKKTSSVALNVECKFVAHFHGKAPVEETHAKKFAESELRLLVWPYFRQFVSDLSARMSVPPLTIPLQSPD